MGRFLARRLLQSVFTVFGVMLVCFVLFRVMSGDISAAYTGQHSSYVDREVFMRKHKLDLPKLYNYARRFEVVDHTTGENVLQAADALPKKTRVVAALGLMLQQADMDEGDLPTLQGRLVNWAGANSPASDILEGKLLLPKADAPLAIQITPADGQPITAVVVETDTCQSLIDAINTAPGNDGRIEARLSSWSMGQLFNSQFFWHLQQCVTFSGESFKTHERLTEIIGKRARYSLSITVPAMALGWLISMVISMLVAYYRGTWIDHTGVLLSVLGMCIPFLAYMIMGQWLMFQVLPTYAWGLGNKVNVYVPVVIAVGAGLGGQVRFYRTIFLNEFHQDYVRTARAKGVPLPAIMFKHVLKNSMLPILTNLVLTIPFLIMGSLLLEQFFGVPGLGDLMLDSITSRDVPIINALVFLTAIIYVVGLLLTDVLYALFDPRIRLK